MARKFCTNKLWRCQVRFSLSTPAICLSSLTDTSKWHFSVKLGTFLKGPPRPPAIFLATCTGSLSVIFALLCQIKARTWRGRSAPLSFLFANLTDTIIQNGTSLSNLNTDLTGPAPPRAPAICLANLTDTLCQSDASLCQIKSRIRRPINIPEGYIQYNVGTSLVHLPAG